MKQLILAGAAFIGASSLAFAAAETSIVQAGQMFSETEISLSAGDHVKFLNQDDVKHNIIVQAGDDDDDAKDMGVQAPGQTIDVPFAKSGKFSIRCHIHPAMKMTVTVK